jgi:hypothetical protein
MGNANFFGFSGTFLVKRESFRPTRTRKGGEVDSSLDQRGGKRGWNCRTTKSSCYPWPLKRSTSRTVTKHAKYNKNERINLDLSLSLSLSLSIYIYIYIKEYCLFIYVKN